MHARIPSLLLASGLALASTAFAQPDETMPVSAVTLYRSGVGSFEREGTVSGNETVSLAFDADQINDILKSLVVIDMDGGRVGAVSYSADEPIARRLQAMGLKDPSQLSLGVLLGEFQGAEVTMTTTGGELTGRILGVETHTITDGDTSRQVRRVSLATNEGLVTVEETDIRNVKLLDASLQRDLNELLVALGTLRTEQSRAVEIDLRGSGERRVRASYVQETPVWKTSYRLVLPESEGEDLHIEGWAIVENTTDHDWEDITLTLVAGRPVGFEMDLSTPLYVPRPQVSVPVEIAAAPKMYERGRGAGDFFEFDDAAKAPASAGLQRSASGQNRNDMFADTANEMESSRLSLGTAMGRSTTAMASGGEEGEVFFFRLDNPVTVDKLQSAMLPIITGPIEGRRVSIFSPSTQGDHPYRGVELTNSTDVKLMPGPLAVFDGSTFAGDAQIGHVGADEKRMLAYAVDLDVDAERTTNQTGQIQRVRIVDGTIRKTEVIQNEYAVTLTNHDTRRERTVVVEVPRYRDWKLTSRSEPYETTDDLYRFEVVVAPDEMEKLSVTQERTQRTSLALTSMNLPTLITYQRDGAASQAVIDAFKGYAKLKGAIEDLERQISRVEEEMQRYENDQRRLRDLLTAISRQDALYARYMGQLEKDEDALDELRARRAELIQTLETKRRELNEYVRSLNVE